MTDHISETLAVKLSNSTLGQLPDDVLRPTYARENLTPGIVHVGLGNFHRAHQAWYLHRLMQAGLAQDWAIVGAGVRSGDAVMREKLLSQDCLTTLIELDPAGSRAEVVGSMSDFLPVEESNGALIAMMADPAIRIVALTVTEGGYYVDAATGGLDLLHPDIRHDIENPDTPKTVFGAIVAALKIRRDAGFGPFTVQSCDNLLGNGTISRQAVVSLAHCIDATLAIWIAEHCTFPNSMVDCIVPATGPAEITAARKLGVIDVAPVTHENYRQWVIEDKFCAGRPDWDKAGAIFTDAVHEYEAMKLRILNAGHQVLANAGELLSIETISGCVSNPEILSLFRKVQCEEIIPYVKPVPGMTPENYVKQVEVRFANPEIHDTTRRVAFDGSSRHMGFVLPILRDALAAGGAIDGLCLVEALWARMCAGIREDATIIEPNDPQWNRLNATSLATRTSAKAWLNQTEIYGDLAQDARFCHVFEYWLSCVWRDGCGVSLKAYADGQTAQ